MMEGVETLEKYYFRLENALANRQEHTTCNADLYHAVDITGAVFRHAASKVLMLSSKLDPAVYGNPDVLENMEAFLSKEGASMDILVEEDVWHEHPTLDLAREFPGKVRMRRVPAAVQQHYKCNFMVMDDCGFRFEGDRNSRSALASFHDDEARSTAAKLRGRFAELWASAEANSAMPRA